MVNINLNIQKKDLWLLSAIMVFLVGIGFVIAYSQPIPNPGHGGDEVFIYINGASKNLQQAIDDGDFSSTFTGDSYSGTIVHGHKGEEIIVNIGGNIKTFQESINDGSLASVDAGTSPSNFGSIIYGNNGDEIWININSQEKTLQQAINDGDFMLLPTAYLSISMWDKNVFQTWYDVYARVTVTEDISSGPPIVGVTVQGTWSGDTNQPVSNTGITDGNGQVTLIEGWVGGNGWVTYTVNSVTMGSDVYELNGTLSGSFSPG